MNESINLRVSKFSPKNKHFGETTSLDTRISTVVSIVNIGYESFYCGLIDQSLTYNNLSMESLKDNIRKIDRNKSNDKKRQTTNEFKRRRKFGKEAKAQQELHEERVDREKNYGTYQSSIAVQDVEPSIENTNKTRQSNSDKLCKHCNLMTNHKTWVSKQCIRHDDYIQQKEQKQQKTNERVSHHCRNQLTEETK